MQRLKGGLTRTLRQYSCFNTRNGVPCNHHSRSFSALPNYATVNDSDFQDQVLVQGRAKSRAAILNRPDSLNALTPPMVARLMRLYESWEENPSIGFVLMKGGGKKAFCAGADVVTLREMVDDGKVEECKRYFETLYKYIYLQATYLKPHVAILHGVTMGCGAGISVPGMFRLVTDKTVFANPEAQIGFHPDAGASFYLSRLPGYLGEYLALTGDKLNGIEMIACGLATHYSLHSGLAQIEDRLGNLVTDDRDAIEMSLAHYGIVDHPDKNSVLHKMELIDKCFSHDTVEEISDALEKEAMTSYNQWPKIALKKIREASPLSLKVTLQSIREGRFQSLDQCLSREYRMSLAGISRRVSNDLFEGVRARLVEKDFAPKWDPPTLADVSKDMVDSYFSRLDEFEPELELPTAIREPYI
ncbi:3-hydroxyisobutyryl-CoA hydrolase-like protein 2, mitochondrial [Linum perenne]